MIAVVEHVEISSFYTLQGYSAPFSTSVGNGFFLNDQILINIMKIIEGSKAKM